MQARRRSWFIWGGALMVIGGWMGVANSGAQVLKNPSAAVKANMKLPTEMERLTMRIEDLEKRAKVAEAKLGPLVADVDRLKEENALLRQEVNKLNWDMYNPGGQIGTKRKIMQKAAWDRIPGDAYLVYYQR